MSICYNLHIFIYARIGLLFVKVNKIFARAQKLIVFFIKLNKTVLCAFFLSVILYLYII